MLTVFALPFTHTCIHTRICTRHQIFVSSCTRRTDKHKCIIIIAPSAMSGWCVLMLGATRTFIRLIERRFESDDTTARTAGHYQRPLPGKIGTAIKSSRDNPPGLFTHPVLYKIALTSPLHRPHCEKMNLIFRLIAGDREKSETCPAWSPLWRYNAQRRRGLFMTERAKFMCNMWRIVSRSLFGLRERRKKSLFRARENCAYRRRQEHSRGERKKVERDRNIT